MTRSKIVGAIAFVSTLIPTIALAQTTDQQAQIQALLQQIAYLQQVLTTLQAPQASPGTTAAACPNPPLARSLSYGSTGADVTSLQQFLISQGDLAPGYATGYFGSLTQAAVQKWQARNGVVSSGTPEATGYGVVGPKTRTAIAQYCASRPSGTITSTAPTGPTSFVPGFLPPVANTGAPLSPGIPGVQAHAYIASFTASPTVLNYGQSTTLSWSAQNAGSCVLLNQLPGESATTINPNLPTSGSLVLTPLQTGVYQLLCTSIGIGGAGANQTVGITVNGAPASANQPNRLFFASPAVGAPPLSVAFTIPVNTNSSCTGGYQFLAFGDGSNTTVPYPDKACSPSTYTMLHTYNATGTFTATLYAGQNASSAVASTSIVTVGGTTTAPSGSQPNGTTLALLAQPQIVKAGEHSTLSWAATNVTSCSLTASPPGFTSNSIAGQQMMQFNGLGTTTFSFSCIGKDNQVHATSTYVYSPSATSTATSTPSTATTTLPTITFTAPAPGTTVQPAQQLNIQYSSANIPANLPSRPAVLLNLIPASSTTLIDYLHVTETTSGQFFWTIPSSATAASCSNLIPNGMCGKNIPPGQYRIQGLLLSSMSQGQILASTTSNVFTIGTPAASTTQQTAAQQAASLVLNATPKEGPSPLLVNFSGSAPGNGYQLDFGDGSPVIGAGTTCAVSSGAGCSQSSGTISFNATHVYLTDGSYTATLKSVGCLVSGVGTCLSTSTVITVGNASSSNTLIATPSTGPAPLNVTFSGTAQGGSYTVDFDDGSQLFAGGSGTAPSTVSTAHTYQMEKTYKPKLYVNGTAVASTTVTVGSGSNPVCNGTNVANLSARSRIIVEVSANVYRKMYNSWPTATEFGHLISQVVWAFYDYELKTHPTNVTMMVGQDLGAALAQGGEGGVTTFKTTYGTSTIPTTSAFITRAYNDIYGAAASTGIPGGYGAELEGLESLYNANASSFAAGTDFNLIARGAIFGEVIGLAIAQNVGTYQADAQTYLEGLCQSGFNISIPNPKTSSTGGTTGTAGTLGGSISQQIGGL